MALAKLLKKEKFNALACGVIPNKEALSMLCKWADRILITEESLTGYLPKEFKDKFVQMHIGEDIWHDADDPELKRVVRRCYYAKKASII